MTAADKVPVEPIEPAKPLSTHSLRANEARAPAIGALLPSRWPSRDRLRLALFRR